MDILRFHKESWFLSIFSYKVVKEAWLRRFGLGGNSSGHVLLWCLFEVSNGHIIKYKFVSFLYWSLILFWPFCRDLSDGYSLSQIVWVAGLIVQFLKNFGKQRWPNLSTLCSSSETRSKGELILKFLHMQVCRHILFSALPLSDFLKMCTPYVLWNWIWDGVCPRYRCRRLQ